MSKLSFEIASRKNRKSAEGFLFTKKNNSSYTKFINLIPKSISNSTVFTHPIAFLTRLKINLYEEYRNCYFTLWV